MKLPFRKNKEFLTALYNILGFYPHNIELYRIAFSHKSLTFRPENNNKDRKGRERRQRSENTSKPLNNERLEYLGDAVLETVVSDILFRHFPNKREGFLTSTRSKIVQREALNKLAADMGLEQLIQAAQGTRMAHTNIGGNAFEALMGAIYLDRGFHHCQWFIANRVVGHFVDLDNVAQKEVNFKSKLLEWSQKNRININFRDVANEGDEKGFRTTITLEGIILGRGTGRSKKESQQIASKEALTRMRCDEKLYDSIFRAKEKRTAMEAEESFALPKIDEIEASINKDTPRKANKKTETPVLEKANQNQATLEADLAYNTAYDENADFEVIDTPPAVHKLTAADYEAKGIPAPPMENELQAAEESEKASRRKRHTPKMVNEAVKGYKKKGREAEQTAQPTGNDSLNEAEPASKVEKPQPAKKKTQPKAEKPVAENNKPVAKTEKQHVENEQTGVETESQVTSCNQQVKETENPLREERPFENQTALPETVIEDALRQASEAAFATIQAAPKEQNEPCMSYLLAAVKAQADQREQLAASEEQPAASEELFAASEEQFAASEEQLAAENPAETLETPTSSAILEDEVADAEPALPATDAVEAPAEMPANEVPALTPDQPAEATVETLELSESASDGALESTLQADGADVQPVQTDILAGEGHASPQQEAAVPETLRESDTDDVATTAICDITAGNPEDEDFHALAQELMTDTQIISFPIDEAGDDSTDDTPDATDVAFQNLTMPAVDFDNELEEEDNEDTNAPTALTITPVTIPAEVAEDTEGEKALENKVNDLHVSLIESENLLDESENSDNEPHVSTSEPQIITHALQSVPEVELAAETDGLQQPEGMPETEKAEVEAASAVQDFIVTKDLIPVEPLPFDEASSEVRTQDSCSLQSDAVAPKLRHLSLDDFVFGVNDGGEMVDTYLSDTEMPVAKNRKPRRKRRKPAPKPVGSPEAQSQEASAKQTGAPARSKRPVPENTTPKPGKAKEQPKARKGAQSANQAEGQNAQSKPQRRHHRPGRKSEA